MESEQTLDRKELDTGIEIKAIRSASVGLTNAKRQ